MDNFSNQVIRIILWLVLSVKFVNAPAQIVINELLASNTGSFEMADEPGEFPDWVEIYNLGPDSVNLKGYYLSDDPTNPTKWKYLYDYWLQPKAFFVFIADNRPEQGYNHLNFKLNKDGDYISLYKSDGVTISDELHFPVQISDVSYGRYPDGAAVWQYMENATAQQSNEEGSNGLIQDISFSHERGFYNEPFYLSLMTESPDVDIYYTMDGSEPEEKVTSSTQKYEAPIFIPSTTIIRAKAVKPDYISSKIKTQTYLFPEDVIHQPRNPNGFPLNWGHTNQGDYAMDQDVVEDPLYSENIVDDLKSIPVLSLAMKKEDWFGNNGIYPSGELDERKVSAEFFNAESSNEFQIDCSVRVVGGSSVNRWRSDKLSLGLKFKSEFGPSKLKVPIYGSDNAQEFNSLILDARFNNSWHYGGDWMIDRYPLTQNDIAQYTRDQFTADLQNAMGGYAPHGFYVHLYLNGLYWGIYNMHERPDEDFASSYLGGRPEDFNILKHNSEEVEAGSNTSYLELFNLPDSLTDPDSLFQSISELVDLKDFINYMIVNYYLGNLDWDNQNWYASSDPLEENGKWRFHSWDAEHIMESVDCDVLNTLNPKSPTELHSALMKCSRYREMFADIVTQDFSETGILNKKNVAIFYQKRLEDVDRAIVCESARWGDNRRSVPFTRDIEWIQERDWLLNTYFPQRGDIVLQQFRNKNWLPTLQSPLVEINAKPAIGPFIFPGDQLTLSAQKGTIWYTLTGIDPKETDNSISPSATEFKSNVPLENTVHLMARVLYNGNWSPLKNLKLLVHEGLQINEIYYHPISQNGIDQSELEYLSLKNFGNDVFNLGGMYFSAGIDYSFPASSNLMPGDSLVLASDLYSYKEFYNLQAFDEYDGKLNNAGERIILCKPSGDTLIDFQYQDHYPWSRLADGKGYSLAYRVPAVNSNINDPINWYTRKVQDLQDGQSPSEIEQPDSFAKNETKIELYNYPNPFSVSTILNYTLPNSDFVSIKIFNTLGRQIATVVDGFQKAGNNVAEWKVDRSKTQSGVYIAQLSYRGHTFYHKLLLIN